MPRTPTSRRRPVTRAALATLTGLLVLAGVACGGDDEGEEAGTDQTAAETTTTSPTTAPLTPEEEAKATYLEFVDVVYELLTTDPNPDDPDLQRLAVDPVLGDLTDNLATMQAENHIVERGDQTRQEVLGVSVLSGEAATIKVCSVGNDRTIDRDDGAVVDEGMSARIVDVSLLRSADGTWQVSELATTQIFDGAVECPR
jgi:hypothetical protein